MRLPYLAKAEVRTVRREEGHGRVTHIPSRGEEDCAGDRSRLVFISSRVSTTLGARSASAIRMSRARRPKRTGSRFARGAAATLEGDNADAIAAIRRAVVGELEAFSASIWADQGRARVCIVQIRIAIAVRRRLHDFLRCAECQSA